MVWQPPTGANTTTSGGGFPIAAPSVLIPRDWQRNQDQAVPGLTVPTTSYDAMDLGGAQGHAPADKPVSMVDALQHLLELGQTDANGTQALQEDLIRAGYLNPSTRYGQFTPGSVGSGDSTYNAYAKLLNDAVVTGNSIYDILNHRISDPKNTTGQKNFAVYQSLTGQKPIEKTVNSTVTSLSTVGDAYKAAQDTYEQLLGRDPNKKEVAALHAALNAYEQAHPQHVSKDVTYDPSMGVGGYQEKNVTSSGGVSAGDTSMVAQHQVASQDSAELGQVQTDRLVQVFESMLGNKNG